MRNVLITGANRGIGLSIVKELLNNDYNVIAVSRNDDNLQELEHEKLKIIKADLQDLGEVQKVFDILDNKGINIDVLINNAGIGKFYNIEDLGFDDWSKVLNLNLSVPFYFMKYILPKMKNRNFGRIINIGSDADGKPEIGSSAYCASKYGLLGLTQCVRLEVKGYNISVTTISPGRVDTYFNSKHPGCRPNSLKAIDVARQVMFVLNMDDRCSIEQIRLSSNFE